MSPPQELPPHRDADTDEVNASVWLLGGWVLMIAYLFVITGISREMAVAGMLLGGVAVVWRLAAGRTRLRRQPRRVLSVTAAASTVATVGTFLNLQYAVGGGSPGLVLAAALACAIVFASAARSRSGSIGFVTPALLVILGNFVLTLLYLRGHPIRIDVEVVLREGVGQLLSGHNPYAMTFTNPYTPEESRLFYAPGILVDNRISLGFPYPPIVLLAAVPGYLLGDVRLSGLILVTVLALAVHGRGRSTAQRSQAVAVATAPGLLFLLSNGWTETLSVALLGLAMLAFRRRQALFAGVLLAAFVVSKQYLVVVLPCLWMLRVHARRGPVVAFCVVGAALTLPWVIADPLAFWRAVSGAHAGGLVRPDSISLVVQGILAWGWADGPLYRWLPVGLGLVVAVASAARLEGGPRGFAAATGITIMATVLVSKQSFFNYYYLVAMSFAIAAVAAPAKSPRAATRADSVVPARGTPTEDGAVVDNATSEARSPVNR